jgi:regulator of sirC expression with transglutaminase-like and TPR domain
MAGAPRYCHAAAYAFFSEQLPSLEETNSLVRAAVAVSMHELTDIDPAAIEATLSDWACEISGRVVSGNPQALVAQLHQVLFDEYGLTGNTADYYNRGNSYLSKVLETRQGIPVTLSLIYKCVAQQLGLNSRGINAPAHFLASVEVGGQWMMVDPFQSGRLLTRDEVFDRLDQMAAAPVERSDALLATSTHPQWIARIIRNVEQIFIRDGRTDDVLAMRELLALVKDYD